MTTEKRKPKNPITKIRTGTGDEGFTYFRGNVKTPKSSVWIEYLGLLDLIQSKTVSYDTQDLIFALGANANNPTKYVDEIDRIVASLEVGIANGTKEDDLKPLTGFLRTTKVNANAMELRAIIRQAEHVASKILFIHPSSYEEEAIILRHIKALNVLSDMYFYIAWWMSSAAAGKNGQLQVWAGK